MNDITRRLFSDHPNHEDLDLFNSCIEEDKFSLGKAAMDNISNKVKWSASSCYLMSTESDLCDLYTAIVEASEEGGSTGVTITNMCSYNAGVFIESVDKMIYMMNESKERPGSVNFIVPVFSDVIPYVLSWFKSKSTVLTNTSTLTILINDTFIKAVMGKEDWRMYNMSDFTSSVSDFTSLDLIRAHGKEFEFMYKRINNQKIRSTSCNAYDLMKKILRIATVNKSPMLIHQDNINFLSTQRPEMINSNSIISGNLCLEIFQVIKDDSFPVCVLGSISLPSYVINNSGDYRKRFDFNALSRDVRVYQQALTYANVKSTFSRREYRKAARENNSIAIGVTGFFEALMDMDVDLYEECGVREKHDIRTKDKWNAGEKWNTEDRYDAGEPTWTNKFSEKVEFFNEAISACIYYNALLSSIRMGKEGLLPVCSIDTIYKKGLFKSDKLSELMSRKKEIYSDSPYTADIDEITRPMMEPSEWGQEGTWKELRQDLPYMVNSQVTGQMPTSTSARRREHSPMWELAHSCVFVEKSYDSYRRRVNTRLVQKAKSLGFSEDEVIDYCIKNHGSFAGFARYVGCEDNPELIRLESNFRTVWEVSQKEQYRLAAVRNKYQDQGASQNIYILPGKSNPLDVIFSCVCYASVVGLTTPMYYLSTKRLEEDGHVVNRERCKGWCEV